MTPEPRDAPAFECRLARLARVKGRVQGVGYRDACVREARRLGLQGWVRNRVDGSVEALFEGSAAQLEAMAAWLHRGPPLARVDAVDWELAAHEAAAGSAGFERRPTV